jgi:predicted chitinase
MKQLTYLFLCSFLIFSCVPEEEEVEVEDDVSGGSVTSKRLQSDLYCLMGKVYGENPVAKKRARTLDFITDRLRKGFDDYGLKSNVERAHLLAQMTHESDGFSATVERRVGNDWRTLFKGSSDVWQCEPYLDAVNGDDSFYNNSYIYSKNSYKSKFRGRGLIQLTGCTNYLGFLYHLSAKDRGNDALAAKHKVSFTYSDSAGRRIATGMYCSDNALNKLDGEFQKVGLDIDPVVLLNDFENSVDEMALPCKKRGINPISSHKFIVDSSLWYWKRCQTWSDYKPYVAINSDKAVARMSQCIHGKHSTYENYQNIDCSINNSDWRKASYCSRRKAFKAAISCLSRPDSAVDL